MSGNALSFWMPGITPAGYLSEACDVHVVPAGCQQLTHNTKHPDGGTSSESPSKAPCGEVSATGHKWIQTTTALRGRGSCDGIA